jgi:hypothetical protein
VIAVVTPVGAQDLKEPVPGPEVKKLDFYVGSWQDEAEFQATPFSPAGKMTGTSKCEWFPGGFYVVCQMEDQGVKGATTTLLILAYDPVKKHYTAYSIDSRGHTGATIGSESNGTWTWVGEESLGTDRVSFRIINAAVSPTEVSAQVETSSDGRNWKTVGQGRSLKVK